MQRHEADEVLDQLHEVLDERFEAGPAPYVIDTMTAEPLEDDDWSVDVVYEPAAATPRQGLRLTTLHGRTPFEAAWVIYRRIEAATTADAQPDEHGVSWTAL